MAINGWVLLNLRDDDRLAWECPWAEMREIYAASRAWLIIAHHLTGDDAGGYVDRIGDRGA